MELLKTIFSPLTQIKGRTSIILIVVEAFLALLLWEIVGQNGLIPVPSKILTSVVAIVTSSYFVDNLFSSLTLTFTGMGISIVLALLVSYLSLIPVFAPIAKFIVKCRYLTLTGLIFLFTLLTQDGHQLKLSLLIFGIVPFFVTSLLAIIEAINVQEYELCKTLRMNNWQTLWEVVIIGRLDQVFEVMRQNFAIAWMMITMVEGLSMSEGGLGTMLIKSNKYIDLGTVFGILVIIFALGIFFDFLLRNLRHWLFPYTKIQVKK
ncbi:ABC transporter permease [Parachryseolinea silvisoli]|jgi:ABC-type nitrate/sulfonate/bicarbonate transport system permease component|uniref:ABC transporter permease n=1 Tax=Parachryseolinea silvisoli TaxID=2873601 RepID=UPI002265E3A8|nr:ABC transporter permease subunit [Parachryseolinea silvisoli]MCD9014461.1 ABC transporter permease subunit [Parachryseolinea silvisoli]